MKKKEIDYALRRIAQGDDEAFGRLYLETKRGVYAFLYSYFSAASEALEQTKTALTKALAQAESVIKEKVNEMTAEYKPQIESALESARRILSTVESMMNILPEPIKAVMNDATADLKEILTETDVILTGGKIELSELRGFASRLDKKATEYLNKIEADLSEEELAEIEKRKAAAIAKMSEQKQTLDKALDDAAKAAKAYLSKLKEERINSDR